jgi:predicted CXXCH cytochrome family protein
MEASEDCFGCHTVGRGKPSGFVSRSARPDLAGVQCESCHGFGSGHHTGLTTENAEALCRTCHDATNSPGFEYTSYLAKIRHW